MTGADGRAAQSTLRPYDPFDLPDWTGTEPVTWRAEASLTESPHVRGSLCAGDLRQQLDLLAVDAAHPRAVCPTSVRVIVHRAWELGEVALLDQAGRVVVAAPGTRFDANAVCEALRRFARSVGAAPHQVTVAIVL